MNPVLAAIPGSLIREINALKRDGDLDLGLGEPTLLPPLAPFDVATAWVKAAPQEYGFYSNVNPAVDHPRWSQATERRIGEILRRKTLMFNGYEAQVGQLYAGMDLKKYF